MTNIPEFSAPLPEGGLNPVSGFQAELQILVNKYSLENLSDTPDFILADYLQSCLEAFNDAVQTRTSYYASNPPANP